MKYAEDEVKAARVELLERWVNVMTYEQLEEIAGRLKRPDKTGKDYETMDKADHIDAAYRRGKRDCSD